LSDILSWNFPDASYFLAKLIYSEPFSEKTDMGLGPTVMTKTRILYLMYYLYFVMTNLNIV
jgi:hypothetical protein